MGGLEHQQALQAGAAACPAPKDEDSSRVQAGIIFINLILMLSASAPNPASREIPAYISSGPTEPPHMYPITSVKLGKEVPSVGGILGL